MKELANNLQSGRPRISVITFVKNGAATLGKAIESVFAQDYPAFEYIVLDAASTDGSVEIIRRHESSLTYWRSRHDGGSVPATNEGWRRATGDVIALLCADDWFEPGAFLIVANAFAEDPSLELVTGGVRIIRRDPDRDRVLTYADEKILNISVATVLCPTITHAHFIRRHIYEELGGYDERFLTSADLDFLLRLAFRGVKSRVLNKVVYNFLQHPGSNSLGGDWRKLGVMAWDNMRVVEEHLKQAKLPIDHVKPLRSFHGVWAMRAIYVALRKSDYSGLWHILRRAFRINPAWPVLVIGWIINGIRKRKERRRHVTYVQT